MKNGPAAVPAMLKALFSSKLRVKILSHLFLHPGERYHVRRLAAVLAAPVGSIGRELCHLERAGILACESVGNQKHYTVRKALPIIEDLRNIFLKTAGAGEELRHVLEKLSGIEIAFLYGSYASGEAHASSDLDLMVIGAASNRELAPAVSRVERRLKREINYTLYTRGDAERRRRKIGDFVHEVLAGPKILLVGKTDDRLLQTG